MKLILEKMHIKFLVSEILMILINILAYRLFSIKVEIKIASILSIIVALIFDYFFCTKYVFKNNLKKNKNRIIQFIFLGMFAFILKHLIIDFFYNLLLLPLIVSKIFGNVIIILFNYFTKYFIFLENYKIEIKRIKDLYEIVKKYWEKFISIKYIRYIFKFLPQNLFVFLFFLISLYYTFTFIRDNDDLDLYNQVVSNSYIKLKNKAVEIEFSNIQVDADVDKICLVFGTYGRENDSTLIFDLFDEKEEIIYNYKINTKKLIDGTGFCLKVPLIDKEKLKKYTLKVTPKNTTEDNHVVLFINKKTKEPTLYLKKTHDIFSFKYIMMLVVTILFLGYNYYFNKSKENILESKYLLLMLGYFLMVLILNPPLEIPDEPSHLYSSYNLSQNWADSNEKTTIVVPENIDCLNYANIQNIDRVVDFKKVTSCLKNSDNEETNLMFGVSNRVTNSFLGHLPQAISIKIADTFSNSPLFIFYFARLGNFLISFIMLYFAIKMAPVGKKILLFIGLTPMFVQQITSLSYDAILNSLSLLFVAYIIRCFYKKDRIKMRSIWIPVIYLLIMLTVKIVYVPLGILLFFIPKDRFKNGNKKITYLISIIILVLMGKYLIQDVFFVNLLQSNGIMENQIKYILENPLQLFPIAINTIKLNGWFYLKSLVGYFCWFRFSLSDFTVLAWLICFVLLILNNKNILNFSSKKNRRISYQKILYIIAILISIGAVFASMYFCWSEYALYYVDGVQGRYFIPILGFIALLFMPQNKKIDFSRETIYSFCNILLFQYLIYLITYFY